MPMKRLEQIGHPQRQRDRGKRQQIRDGHENAMVRRRFRLDRFLGDRVARQMLARDHMHADIAGMAHDIANDRAVDEFEPARALGLAHHDLRHVIGARVGQHIVGDISAAGDRDRFALKLFRNPQGVGDAVALDLGQVLAAAGLDIDRGPGRVQPVGQPLGVAHKPGANADPR